MFVQVEVLMDSGRKRHSGKLGFVRPYLEIGRKVRDEGELGFEASGRLTSGRIQQEYKIRRNKVTFWLKMNNLITYFIHEITVNLFTVFYKKKKNAGKFIYS